MLLLFFQREKNAREYSLSTRKRKEKTQACLLHENIYLIIVERIDRWNEAKIEC
jgi:hypothetical protein